MADIEQSSHDDSGKKRSKKMSTRIDLTAMVDLAFLLVTFFMLTTTFSKPQAMELVMPEKNDDPNIEKPEVPASIVITVMPTKNNKVVYYKGLMDGKAVLEPLVTDYSPSGLRKILTDKKREVDAANPGKDKTLAIIKPDSSSTYKNMVDTIDEMAIVGIKRYAIVDLARQEKQMIAAAKL